MNVSLRKRYSAMQNISGASVIERDRIPDLLKSIDRWVVWRGFPRGTGGKIDKVPCHPITRKNINGLIPSNWLTFEQAIEVYDHGGFDGIGIALSTDHPVNVNGAQYVLTALDFDDAAKNLVPIKKLWELLGKPYKEISPSSRGMRMFALCRSPVTGGNDGAGRELYCTGRFMTVTGRAGSGDIVDATERLMALDEHLFGSKKITGNSKKEELRNIDIVPPQRPETAKNVLHVKNQLAFVSADTDYDTWRDIVWSVLSTGWSCAEEVAREWSMTAAHRYTAKGFNNLVKSFKPDGGITLGTLDYHAKQGGWTANERDPAGKTAASIAATRLLTGAEVKALPTLPYRVRGLLPAKGVAAVYGEPGSGKSFLALDLSFAIAAGMPDWFDRRVKPAPVIYVALEGQGGISKRILAWEKQHGRTVPRRMRFLLRDLTLLDAASVSALAAEAVEAVGEGAVLVVDTLAQSAPGADENSSKDMGVMLANAQKLAEAIQGLVILIHHSDKDRSKGMRGHSSLLGAVDASIEVLKEDRGRSWTVKKSKDDVGGIGCGFELVFHVVGKDEDDEEITSCAVRRTFGTGLIKPKPLSGKRQKAAMACLQQVLAATPGGIRHEDAVRHMSSTLSVPEGRRSTAAKETIDRLLSLGHLILSEGVIRTP